MLSVSAIKCQKGMIQGDIKRKDNSKLKTVSKKEY